MIPLEAVATRIRERDDACFGCGSANPAGLRLDGFERRADEIVARFHPRPEHHGFSGMLHGGIVATALDGSFAWTAMLDAGVFVVTATLKVRYRAPAPADGAYSVAGRIVERRGRRLRLTGRLRLGDATVAEADGLFIATGPVGTSDPVGPTDDLGASGGDG